LNRMSIDWYNEKLQHVDPDKKLRTSRETSQGTLIMCVVIRNPGPMDVSQSLNTPWGLFRLSWNDI